MRAISNAPANFQSSLQRLIESKTATCPAFCEIVEAQVKAQVEDQKRTPTAAGRNQRQSVSVLTPDEATAAQNSHLGQLNRDMMEAGGDNDDGTNLPGEPTGNGGSNPSSLPPPLKITTLIEYLKKLAEDQGEDTAIIVDLEMQGKVEPSDLGIFQESVFKHHGLASHLYGKTLR